MPPHPSPGRGPQPVGGGPRSSTGVPSGAGSSPGSGRAGVRPVLRVGSLDVWPPVELAPMAGVTDAAFRRLARSLVPGSVRASAAAVGTVPGLFVAEMATAAGIVAGDAATLALLPDAGDVPRSAQVYGADPAVVGEAVRRLVGEHGVAHVDVNLGCPTPKITRRGGGAALPVRPALLGRILGAAVAAAGAVPVTVKMRLGVSDDLLTYLEAGRVAAGVGVAAVALHARTADQRYTGPARWEFVAALVDALDVPVLGNGDIRDGADARHLVERSGAAGVVIGRACLGRPWVVGNVAAVLAGLPEPAEPTWAQVREIVAAHGAALAAAYGEGPGMLRMRRHLGWYLSGFAGVAAASVRPPDQEPTDRPANETRALRVENEVRPLRTAASQVGDLVGLGAWLAAADAVIPASARPGAATALFRGGDATRFRVPMPQGWLADRDRFTDVDRTAGLADGIGAGDGG